MVGETLFVVNSNKDFRANPRILGAGSSRFPVAGGRGVRYTWFRRNKDVPWARNLRVVFRVANLSHFHTVSVGRKRQEIVE